jgi:hypothetical protein
VLLGRMLDAQRDLARNLSTNFKPAELEIAIGVVRRLRSALALESHSERY